MHHNQKQRSDSIHSNESCNSYFPLLENNMYDINGRIVTPELAELHRHKFSQILFDRMVTSDNLKLLEKRRSKRQQLLNNAILRPQTVSDIGSSCEDAVLDYVKKLHRAKSAKTRYNVTLTTTTANPTVDHKEHQHRHHHHNNLLVPKIDNNQRRGSTSSVGSFRRNSLSRYDNDDCSCSSVSSRDSNCSSEYETINTSEEGEELQKQKTITLPPAGQIKLKVAMADFTRKIEENEGTTISTFSYRNDQPQETIESEINKTVDTTPPNIAEETRKVTSTSPSGKKHRRRKKKHVFDMPPGDKFRRAVKTINLLIKACTSKTEQTRKNQMRAMTFSDITDNLAAQDTEDIANSRHFDVDYYKARKEMTLTYEARECLRLHSSMRTREMQHAALLSLQATVDVFSEFPMSMQKSLVRVGWYEKFDSKRIIIRQGHNALNYYFIISGTTVVTVASKNASGETINVTVAFLKKGESFGELALMYGGKRSATVYCKDDVELLAVNREDFIDIFMNLNTEDEPDHIKFLRHIPLLEDWPIDSLPFDDPRICLFTYFRRGTVLVKDSNKNDWIYIIKSGTCKIIKDIFSSHANLIKLKSKCRMSELIPVEESEQTQYIQFLHEDVEPAIRDSYKNYGPLVTQTKNSAFSDDGTRKSIKKPGDRMFIQLKLLAVKDVFGLEPIAFDIFGGTTSVTLVSEGAECVLIRRDFFVNKLSEKYCKKLRKEIQPFPTLESLDEKLQAHCNWSVYKECLVNFLMYNNHFNM